MANLHAIRDEITRNRVDLTLNLNKLYAEDPEAGILAFQLQLQQLHLYFKGSTESEEPVKEQSPDVK